MLYLATAEALPTQSDSGFLSHLISFLKPFICADISAFAMTFSTWFIFTFRDKSTYSWLQVCLSLLLKQYILRGKQRSAHLVFEGLQLRGRGRFHVERLDSYRPVPVRLVHRPEAARPCHTPLTSAIHYVKQREISTHGAAMCQNELNFKYLSLTLFAPSILSWGKKRVLGKKSF